MSKYRYLYTVFWKDPYIRSLNKDERTIFLYLLTNEDTKQCGVYTFDKEGCIVDTGVIDISKIIDKFCLDNKVQYNSLTNEIAIKNWNKYNKSKSPKVIKHIADCLQNIKDKSLINFCYNDIELKDMEEIYRIAIVSTNKKKNKKKKYIYIPFFTKFCQQDDIKKLESIFQTNENYSNKRLLIN